MPRRAVRIAQNPDSPALSVNQRRLLQLVCNWPRGEHATRDALASALGLASEAGVRFIARPLLEMRLLEERTVGRLVRVYHATEAGCAALEPLSGVSDVQQVDLSEQSPVVSFPYIHAGGAGAQYETTPRYTTLKEILGLRGDEYKITVVGDCMSGGERPIREGDMVLLSPRSRIYRPLNGSVAHVELRIGTTGENEILLRQYFYDEESRQVTLRCFKPGLRDEVHDDDDVDPRGEVLWVIGAANPNK